MATTQSNPLFLKGVLKVTLTVRKCGSKRNRKEVKIESTGLGEWVLSGTRKSEMTTMSLQLRNARHAK